VEKKKEEEQKKKEWIERGKGGGRGATRDNFLKTHARKRVRRSKKESNRRKEGKKRRRKTGRKKKRKTSMRENVQGTGSCG
jgi:hypothetical protein